MAGELQQIIPLHTAVTASVAVGDAVATPIAGVRKATVFLTVTGTGNWTITASVSADGTNYATFNKLIPNLTNAISEGLTRLAEAPAAGITTTDFVTIDLSQDAFAYLKVGVTEKSGTGTITAKMVLEYY